MRYLASKGDGLGPRAKRCHLPTSRIIGRPSRSGCRGRGRRMRRLQGRSSFDPRAEAIVASAEILGWYFRQCLVFCERDVILLPKGQPFAWGERLEIDVAFPRVDDSAERVCPAFRYVTIFEHCSLSFYGLHVLHQRAQPRTRYPRRRPCSWFRPSPGSA